MEPLFVEPQSDSLLPRAALKVPVIVCELVFVKKSEAESPVSADISRFEIVCVGVDVSRTYACVAAVPTAPDALVARMAMVPEEVRVAGQLIDVPVT